MQRLTVEYAYVQKRRKYVKIVFLGPPGYPPHEKCSIFFTKSEAKHANLNLGENRLSISAIATD